MVWRCQVGTHDLPQVPQRAEVLQQPELLFQAFPGASRDRKLIGPKGGGIRSKGRASYGGQYRPTLSDGHDHGKHPVH